MNINAKKVTSSFDEVRVDEERYGKDMRRLGDGVGRIGPGRVGFVVLVLTLTTICLIGCIDDKDTSTPFHKAVEPTKVSKATEDGKGVLGDAQKLGTVQKMVKRFKLKDIFSHKKTAPPAPSAGKAKAKEAGAKPKGAADKHKNKPPGQIADEKVKVSSIPLTFDVALYYTEGKTKTTMVNIKKDNEVKLILNINNEIKGQTDIDNNEKDGVFLGIDVKSDDQIKRVKKAWRHVICFKGTSFEKYGCKFPNFKCGKVDFDQYAKPNQLERGSYMKIDLIVNKKCNVDVKGVSILSLNDLYSFAGVVANLKEIEDNGKRITKSRNNADKDMKKDEEGKAGGDKSKADEKAKATEKGKAAAEKPKGADEKAKAAGEKPKTALPKGASAKAGGGTAAPKAGDKATGGGEKKAPVELKADKAK